MKSWYNRVCSSFQFKRMYIDQQKNRKKIKQKCAFDFCESNYTACKKTSLCILRHLLTKHCPSHFIALMKSGVVMNSRVVYLRYCFRLETDFANKLTETFRVVYGVENCLVPILMLFSYHQFCTTYRA